MKIGMYGGIDNGRVRDRTIDYIAIDQGLSFLLREGIKPIVAIGDFDSLEEKRLLEKVDVLRYDPVKDDTDTAIALKWAIEHGYDEIEITGVMQGRMDHFLGVLCLLEQYRDINITLYDQKNCITLLKAGEYEIDCQHYHYFSIFAIDDTRLTLRKCAYELNDYLLKRHDPLCVSNQCESILYLHTTADIFFIQAS